MKCVYMFRVGIVFRSLFPKKTQTEGILRGVFIVTIIIRLKGQVTYFGSDRTILPRYPVCVRHKKGSDKVPLLDTG